MLRGTQSKGQMTQIYVFEIDVSNCSVGEATWAWDFSSGDMWFQSTLPVGGRDFCTSSQVAAMSKFQSTLPAWHPNHTPATIANKFQSTLPAWGATPELLHDVGFGVVSIHAPALRVRQPTATSSPTSASWIVRMEIASLRRFPYQPRTRSRRWWRSSRLVLFAS
jgi:hypothetical protein